MKSEAKSEESNETAVTLFGSKTDLPAHLNDRIGQGNENVGADDVAIPRLKMVQKLSAEYDEIGQDGVYLNTISHEVYDSPYVINLHYIKEYVIFKDRKLKLGTDYQGSFTNKEEAEAHKASLPRPEDYVINEQGRHILLLLDEEGKPVQPLIYSLAGTAMQVSRMWNSQILVKGKDGPRHGTVWQLDKRKMSNDQGTWYVPEPVFMGFTPADLFEAAQKFYEETKSV